MMELELNINDYKSIAIGLLEPNDGQLQGLPENPRTCDDSEYETLKRNLTEYPQLLNYDRVKVFALDNGHYIVIGGNTRLRALNELGFSEVPCAIIDPATSIDDLKGYAIIDNVVFGQWCWDMIANEWEAKQMSDWGVKIPTMPTGADYEEFFEENSDDDPKATKIVVSLPECYASKKDAIKERLKTAVLAKFSGCKVK